MPGLKESPQWQLSLSRNILDYLNFAHRAVVTRLVPILDMRGLGLRNYMKNVPLKKIVCLDYFQSWSFGGSSLLAAG